VIADTHIDTLDPEQLRQALRALQAEVARKDELIAQRDHEAAFKQAVIDKLTHENAVLKRLKFAAKSEGYTAEQRSLIEETLDADLAALAAEIEALEPGKKAAEGKRQPKREKLPANLPRREIRHEPQNTTCGCGQAMQRIGEDVAEKLDYLSAQRVALKDGVDGALTGFFSTRNEAEAHGRGVKRVAIPNLSTKSAERKALQHKRWFRNAMKWRTGCEGRISLLKRRHGLDRCRYKGTDGMKRWVGLGVIADNLINIAQALDSPPAFCAGK